jgi:hypothetical protein
MTKQSWFRAGLVFGGILLAALLIFTWFKPNERYYGTDTYFPENRLDFFHLSYSSWDNRSLGNDNFRMYSVAYPYGIYLAATEKVGLEVSTAQHIWLYLLFAISGISFAVFTYLVWGVPKKKLYHGIYFLGAIVYMFNPFTGIMFYSFPYLFHLYAFLPLKLALIYYGISRKKGILYCILILIPWIFLTTSSYSNPKYLLVEFVPMSVMVLTFLRYHWNKETILHTIKFLAFFFIFFCLLSAFWLLPTGVSIKENISSMHAYYETLGDRSREINFAQDSTKDAFDAIRQLGYWAINGKLGDASYLPWVSVFNGIGGVTLSFATVLMFLLPFYFKIKNKLRTYKILFIAWFFSLLGMLGVSSFIGVALTLLIKKLPYFIEAFSNPFQIFGLYATMLFSLLLVSVVVVLNTNAQATAQKILGLLAVGILATTVLFFSTPFLRGDIVRRSDDLLRQSTYVIPGYVSDLYAFLKQESQTSDFRTFFIPYSKTHYASYLWEDGYNGLDLNSLYMGNDVAGVNSGPSLLTHALAEGNITLFDTLLPLYNVKYVIVTLDANIPMYQNLSTWYEGIDLQEIISSLPKSRILSYKTSFGPILVYEVNTASFIPKVYVPKHLLLEKELGSRDDFVAVRGTMYASTNTADDTSLQVTAQVTNTKKISESEYQATVDDVSLPFTLILNTNYHPEWQLSVLQGGVWQKLSVSHIVINGYANGWALKPTVLCSSATECKNNFPQGATFRISFDRRKYFYQGYVVSGITLILLLILGGIQYIRYAKAQKHFTEDLS